MSPLQLQLQLTQQACSAFLSVKRIGTESAAGIRAVNRRLGALILCLAQTYIACLPGERRFNCRPSEEVTKWQAENNVDDDDNDDLICMSWQIKAQQRITRSREAECMCFQLVRFLLPRMMRAKMRVLNCLPVHVSARPPVAVLLRMCLSVWRLLVFFPAPA